MSPPHRRAIVTTSRKPSSAATSEALDLARELGLPFVPREEGSLPALFARLGVEGILAVAQDRVTYYTPGAEFFFHPSMAKQRLRFLQLGQRDVAVEAMALARGMSVLDCTLGRAADACVAAFVVGEEGRVVGLEADPILAALTRRGLVRFDPQSPALAAAMRRVEVICADHAEYLAGAPDRGFDVVYFDPFFEHTLEDSQAMQGLRAVGRHGPVAAEALREALRVARRRVVYKTKRSVCPAGLSGPGGLVGPKEWEIVGGRKSRIEYRVFRTEEGPGCAARS